MATNTLPGKMSTVRLQLHLKSKNDTTSYIRVSANVYRSNNPVGKSLGHSMPAKILEDVAQAVEEMNLIKKGKLKGRNAEDLFDEL